MDNNKKPTIEQWKAASEIINNCEVSPDIFTIDDVDGLSNELLNWFNYCQGRDGASSFAKPVVKQSIIKELTMTKEITKHERRNKKKT